MPKTYAKVVIDGTTYIDLTGDTVEPETLLYSETAHDKSGSSIQGSFLSGWPGSFALSDILVDGDGKGITDGGAAILAETVYQIS